VRCVPAFIGELLRAGGNSMRDVLISDEEKRLQRWIKIWADRHIVLWPGERLTLSLRIEGKPINTHIAAACVEMTVEQFFSVPNLKEHGVPLMRCTRMSNAIRKMAYRLESELEMREKMNMRDFALHCSLDEMRRSPGIGPTIAQEAIDILEKIGLI
jgi:hypothetical protein